MLDPENAQVAFRWANLCLYYERRPRRAHRLLQRAIELKPDFAAAHHALETAERQLQNKRRIQERHEDEMLAGIPGIKAFAEEV